MIITDYNKMTLSELESVYKKTGARFVIKAGKITGVTKKKK